MNGAITDPCVNTNSAPISTRVMMSGASQYFLRTRMKSQMSLVSSKSACMRIRLESEN